MKAMYRSRTILARSISPKKDLEMSQKRFRNRSQRCSPSTLLNSFRSVDSRTDCNKALPLSGEGRHVRAVCVFGAVSLAVLEDLVALPWARIFSLTCRRQLFWEFFG
jgi:hypothetical protein